MRVWAMVAIAVIVGFGLTACVATGPAIFDRPLSDADRLPNDVVIPPEQEIDPDSVRLAGSHDGVDYYVAKHSSRQPSLCLVINNADVSDDWVVGCGGDTEVGAGSTKLGKATYFASAPSAREVPEGWVQLNENLIIRPAP